MVELCELVNTLSVNSLIARNFNWFEMYNICITKKDHELLNTYCSKVRTSRSKFTSSVLKHKD